MNIIPFEKTYWVIPNKLIAGQTPSSYNKEIRLQKLINLLNIGIKVIINLTHENENNDEGSILPNYFDEIRNLAKSSNINIELYRIPINDYSIPSEAEMRTIFEIINKSISNNKSVFVHCWGGVGRTGTVIACFLKEFYNANNENVFEFLQYLRRTIDNSDKFSPETEEQKEFIINWRK